jgi:hypothetical protein
VEEKNYFEENTQEKSGSGILSLYWFFRIYLPLILFPFFVFFAYSTLKPRELIIFHSVFISSVFIGIVLLVSYYFGFLLRDLIYEKEAIVHGNPRYLKQMILFMFIALIIYIPLGYFNEKSMFRYFIIIILGTLFLFFLYLRLKEKGNSLFGKNSEPVLTKVEWISLIILIIILISFSIWFYINTS